MPERDREQLEKELGYYKRRVDELAGEHIKLDYTISGLRHEIEQKRQGFALLSDLQLRVRAGRQLSSIFETTVEAISSTLGMDRTLVLSPTEREHVYRPTQWLGFREDENARVSSLEVELPADIAKGDNVVLVNKSTVRTPFIENIQAAFDLPFFIAVPVMGDRAPIGILLSGRLKEARPMYPALDQGDLDTFHAIAGLIAASVRNMRVAVLEEMDRLKTDFFANISHEFRTPITLTLGPIDQVLSGRYGELPQPARAQLGVMRRNQERLLGLVSQILDLAKLEAGGMELRAAPIADLNRFVSDRIEHFRAAAEKRGLTLRTTLRPEVVGQPLYIDSDKLDKLLFNLLSNALKFTKVGSIEVSTGVEGGSLRLTVSDTGIGIKEDQLPHIFDRFRQADGSDSREYAGTGIGLALVQEVAKLHVGTVEVFSQYGRGTTFRVLIPLGRAHLNPASVVDQADDDPMGAEGSPVPLVLEGATDREGASSLNAQTEAAFDSNRETLVYAEDNPDLRAHLRDMLAPHYNVFLAVDGRDGVEMARKYRPDLIITDQMMPNMNGRDLLHAVRADPDLKHTPVVFLTARVGADARIESLEAGADDYLNKPFHEAELLARVRNLLRARQQERVLAELNRRLDARVEEQLAELVRNGELHRFLPAPVVESILSGRMDAEAERFDRRKITVLSSELAGLSELTDQLEPEELAELANEYFRELSAACVENGAVIAGIGANTATAIFGAPQPLALEDQAWRAVLTSIGFRDRIRELRAQWRRRGLPDSLDIRIGISTGFCTVGVFGSEAMRTFTAVGMPVTTAVLLQSLADPGSIVCSLPTQLLIEQKVTMRPLGLVPLPGLVRPVEAFELLAIVSGSPEVSRITMPR